MNGEKKLFVEYLKKKGLKTTRQRMNILDSFLEENGHVSAFELYESLKKKYPDIGFSTVYRTLKLFTECGLANEVNFGEGQSRFEKAYKREYHGHLICQTCGDTHEFSAESLQNLQERILTKHGYKPLGFKFEIYGICRKCQKK